MGDLVTFPKLKQLAPSAADLERDTQVFEVSWFGRKFYRHEAEKLKEHGIHAMFDASGDSFFVMRKDIERMCEILAARINGIVDGGSTDTRKVVIDLRSNHVAATATAYLERKDEDDFLARQSEHVLRRARFRAQAVGLRSSQVAQPQNHSHLQPCVRQLPHRQARHGSCFAHPASTTSGCRRHEDGQEGFRGRGCAQN